MIQESQLTGQKTWEFCATTILSNPRQLQNTRRRWRPTFYFLSIVVQESAMTLKLRKSAYWSAVLNRLWVDYLKSTIQDFFETCRNSKFLPSFKLPSPSYNFSNIMFLRVAVFKKFYFWISVEHLMIKLARVVLICYREFWEACLIDST